MSRLKSWTNKSVLALAQGSDPVEAIRSLARDVVARALDAGWSGPPFDPIALADHLGLVITARDDIADARTVPTLEGIRIEFNPNRPRGRMRYSLAHEIAHTLFADCADKVRHRGQHHALRGDEWQIETLCNIAASELVMPLGSIPKLSGEALDFAALMRMRADFDVSTEALLLRVVRVTDEACAVFCASRTSDSRQSPYRVEYLVASTAFPDVALESISITKHPALDDCTAIGARAMGTVPVPGQGRGARVDCIGLAPFPGSVFPRVAGFIRPADTTRPSTPGITYLIGDATTPTGDFPIVVAHVVNDKTPNWGGNGFASAVRRAWPIVQSEFREWAERFPREFRLGRVHRVTAAPGLTFVQMVAQKGYGIATAPRIRYAALEACLSSLADIATEMGATIHVPRIGAGQAGGNWAIIEELINAKICARGLRVKVYDLPGSRPRVAPQMSLGLGASSGHTPWHNPT